MVENFTLFTHFLGQCGSSCWQLGFRARRGRPRWVRVTERGDHVDRRRGTNSRKVSAAEGDSGIARASVWTVGVAIPVVVRLKPPSASRWLCLRGGTAVAASLCLAGPGKTSVGTSGSWQMQSVPFATGMEHRDGLLAGLRWHVITHYAVVIWLYV